MDGSEVGFAEILDRTTDAKAAHGNDKNVLQTCSNRPKIASLREKDFLFAKKPFCGFAPLDTLRNELV
jgi:hypothetical protein